MDVLGFYVRRKFRTLRIRESETWEEFVKEMRGGFSGLVLFHGNPFEPFQEHPTVSPLSILLPAVAAGQCAVVIVDTEVFKRPPDCRSPYIHFYSTSVPNRNPNPFEPLFQRLVDQFRQVSSLPSESAMKKMWFELDPHADELAVLRMFEEVLYAQEGEQDRIPDDLRSKLRPPFGTQLSTYSALKAEYLSLCRETNLKKN